MLASQLSDPGSMPSPGNKRWGLLRASDRSTGDNEATLALKPVGSHPESETEGGLQKWTQFNKNLTKKDHGLVSWWS